MNISCDSPIGKLLSVEKILKNFWVWLYKTTSLISDGKNSKQTDGVAAGSLLRPRLDNAFLCFYEWIWLNDCSEDFKPVYYRRYVDDIFALFRSPDHLEKFTSYLNSRHKNIKFSYEKESNNALSFLDFLMLSSENVFKTSVYHKPIFSWVYSNFNIFFYSFFLTFLFRTFSIVTDFSRFHM